MRGPFTREDARMRAKICRYEAETWQGVVREREQFRDLYEPSDDRDAAEGCLEIARMRVQFAYELADAYERVAEGKTPFL